MLNPEQSQTEMLIAKVRIAQVERAQAEHIERLAELKEQQAIKQLMDHLVAITPLPSCPLLQMPKRA